jgi:hypothetical protein
MTISLIEISDLIRLLGLAYLAGIVISTSGIFPSFTKPQFSDGKFSAAQNRLQEKQLGWGFGLSTDTENNAKKTILTWIAIIVLIVLAYFGLSWVENAQIPTLNIALGIAFLSLGLNYRRQFLLKWAGRSRNLDLASFLLGLFFVITQL